MNFLKSGIERLVALALICGLVLLAVPVMAQELGDNRDQEEILLEQTFQEIERAQAEGAEIEAAGAASSAVPMVTKKALRSTTAAATGSLRCLPTCDVNDSRFMVIASQNFRTLSESSLNLQISVPADATSFTIGIFDGDARGVDTANLSHWDSGNPALYEYTLFADPTGEGNGTTPVLLDGSSSTVLATAMPDNAWIDYPINTGPEARTPSGNYFYRLTIRLTSPSILTQNAFKIRTTAVLSGLTLDPIARPFSYISNVTSVPDLQMVYPSYPAVSPTRYDGTFSFYFDVPTSQTDMTVWDGDFDRGKFDGTERDTDDPDTLNAPFLPSWFTIDTVSEGISVGTAGSTGSPPDDRSAAGTGIYFLKSPSVRYDLIFPDGRTFANDNPSGNQEWEQFRISMQGFDPSQMDYSVSSIPPGTYHLRISGVDMGNLNALLLPFKVVCVDDTGVPCTLLRPFLIGDKVFRDTDGDGSQGSTEAGIAGVVVNLLDAAGVILATTTTAVDGSYAFNVDKGFYIVAVADESFAAGGPLEGTVSTTGGERRSATVTTDNVMTYDFGYRGTASLGSLVWVDTNNNGAQDAGEPGIGGVTVDLLDGSGNVIASTTTDANGGYRFSNLTDGSYSVRVRSSSLPAGTSPTFDLDGTGTAHLATVALTPGQNRTDVNFGYRLLGNILGRLWNDSDADGVAEAGETGLNSVTVQLVDSTGTVVATTTTSGDGNYSFPNLPAGIYTVRVDGATLPSGAVATGDYDGVATLNRASLDLPGGATVANVDFGYFLVQPGVGTGTIGYWKNHSSAWPVAQITLGGVTYTKSQAIALIGQPSRGDKTIDLAKQLIASKLNLLIGNNPSCISGTISQADAWLAANPVGSNVRSGSVAWTVGGPIHQRLDDYNNGKLCAPHRD